MRTPKLVNALNVTATTISSPIDIREAKKVTLLFTRSNHGSGNTVFTVDGSIDSDSTTGVFEPLNILIDNVTNTNAQTLTRVASCTLAANDSKMYALDLDNFGFTFIKITATETTDGTHIAKVLVEY